MNWSYSLVVDAVYPNGSLVRPPTPADDGIGCSFWRSPNHVLYQCANAAIVLGLLAPKKKFGNLFLHSMFVLGFLLLSVWAWTILCAPDIFSWNFAFMVVNVLQMLFLMYYIRPIKFTGELENLYVTMFEPMKVSRKLFKKLVCPDFCSVGMLHEAEPYAIYGVSRTERLGLLLTGMMKVYSNKNILHSIREYEFIDSPEFESSMTGEEKYQVSIIADCTCRYVYWPRQSLEYLLMKEPFLATVMNTMIGYDITNKLYALNDRVTEKNGGCRQDIRLPGVASVLKRASHQSYGNLRSTQQLHPDAKGNVRVDFEDEEEMDIIEAERVEFLNGHIQPSVDIDCSSKSSESSSKTSGIHINI
ncbi:hypothetical protein CHS0354_007881 [Potamilus streckersoni]|uniref:POPDC1-3 domain-containing protein n=1 Tax=Potamilus streckersoni TaxID=2493646 RepID=A0AAE0SYM9_9BIVA|nr:hypothetical protein CHS0354_007881 [Potamilus streckersoni]